MSLKVRQFSEIFADLGYETELVDVQAGLVTFKNTITNNLKMGNLIIGCFAVNRRTEFPTTLYERDNEHAAILHGFNETTDQLDMRHWDKHRQTTMLDFYNSSMSLLNQRNPEYYINIKHKKTEMKYDLIRDERGIQLPSAALAKKSLVPTEGSGFRGKLFVIKQPQLQTILAARKKLLISHHKEIIIKLLEKIKIKTDELIKKGSKQSKHFIDYQKVGKKALKLNKQLDAAATETITLEEFKQKCQTIIATAKPEFASHRGWHQVNSTLRKFLGFLAIVTVVPAIVVELSTRHGYLGTFFESPKTDALEKIESFMENINKLP
jgi:hypothetical protein